MAERGYRHPFAYLEARLHVAFNLLQMGRVEEGRDTYLGTMTELRRRGPSGGWEMPMDVESFIEWGDAVERNFGPAVAAATTYRGLPCPYWRMAVNQSASALSGASIASKRRNHRDGRTDGGLILRQG